MQAANKAGKPASTAVTTMAANNSWNPKMRKRLRSTLEKHPEEARDFYKANKMTKVTENKITKYLTGQI